MKNRNIVAKIEQDSIYKKYEEEYAELIKKGANSSEKAKKSNKIWILWMQGESKAPELVKACIKSVRMNLKDYEMMILTEENLKDYVKLPEYIEKKWKEKKISAAHYSDIIRITLLCEYGGIWMDATVLCTSANIPETIACSPLFVYQVLDLTRLDREPIIASSWFISAYSNQPILLLTRDLLYKYWETNEYIENYFIFHIFFALAARRYEEDWKKVPVYNNQSPHTLQFELGEPYSDARWNEILQMSVFHKLNHHNDYTNAQGSFYHHIIRNFLIKG